MIDRLRTNRTLIERKAYSLVETSLSDTRVVLIAGPRQAGKTTLARQFEGPDRAYLTLDDVGTLQAARTDPVGFIRGVDRVVIDEVQRAPELMLAIKESVDRDETPGRFLLTGSANLTAIPSIADSLAGRMAVIPLLPLAQAEIQSAPGRLLDRLFAGEAPVVETAATIGTDLIDIVLRGGYPEAIRRPTPGRRTAWLEDYVALILDRDVRDIANIDQLDRMPRLLNILAEHAGQLVNHSSFGSALGLSSVTTQKYVAILERLFLIKTLPPWSNNRLSRLVKTPKLHFIDTGLLASMREDEAERLRQDRTRFGALLESFVVSELMKLASWSERRVSFSHYRTKDQDEVDVVIEDRRGRIIGIEVKASATVRAQDFRGLRQLQEAVGDRFVRGLVLHDHDRVTPFGEKLQAAPTSVLWTM
ncbi:ATP-binding protein (plasmid) [Agrobacterium tumefaciens]|uniref:ATP-binding protein n=1 Tax=Agrobacterium tumefaciens TaxID=358 RepID=A0AAP9J9F0_AGRTU|nr:ATP-binding protein [Agrobacterium tumefaciens]NSZ61160.1 ATP-binding protein [Agrobacterium tumefaciens]QDY97573.1 ATP-binding protein [Agrobacterium tumefaciens]UXS12700.1 ATP-binding protein [Agrobacterium tumefaciens]UXS20062.1 ATP-binding protein [Agrobacterium tumefaciens]UXS27710.1 ATP-binding protein [Agrobacterium tumefaciens]